MPTQGHARERRLLADPDLRVIEGLLDGADADRQLATLDRELAWQQPRLRLYGREHPIPRRQVWMGDPMACYRYSGREFVPEPWHPAAAALRDAASAWLTDAGLPSRFNAVLVNRYATGEERMGWHSDDEPELGPEPLIAAMSLGAERPLRMRWKDGSSAPFNVWLPHGSLLVMGPGVQARLEHALLPRRIPGLRISLTFRLVNPSPPAA